LRVASADYPCRFLRQNREDRFIDFTVFDTAGEVTLAVDEGGKGTENGPDLGCFEAPPDFASSIVFAEEPDSYG